MQWYAWEEWVAYRLQGRIVIQAEKRVGWEWSDRAPWPGLRPAGGSLSFYRLLLGTTLSLCPKQAIFLHSQRALANRPKVVRGNTKNLGYKIMWV